VTAHLFVDATCHMLYETAQFSTLVVLLIAGLNFGEGRDDSLLLVREGRLTAGSGQDKKHGQYSFGKKGCSARSPAYLSQH
jgi:hypothetical protein